MLVSSNNRTSALTDQYRLLDPYGTFKVATPGAAKPGYFLFGRNAVCYGRTRIARAEVADDLCDVRGHVRTIGSNPVLPFDPDEVIDNLRYERYIEAVARTARSRLSALAKKTYYTVRPFLPERFRKRLQGIYLSDWNRIAFPSWPVDHTVESVFEELLLLSLESHSIQRLPFIWFWPDGYSACSIMTHDIETEAGRNFSTRLADLDASFRIKSSFQIVPEERYEVPASFLDSIRERGCEINLHGLNHDGQLFRDRNEFQRRVRRINQYAKEYRAAGFRSPVMYRNLSWYGDLDFSYDMSVPNVAHLDPQRGGCCTVLPYFIGNMVELPLTTTQDYQLFNIIKEWSTALWQKQIRVILDKHGLISFNVHPDYMISDRCRDVYARLLEHLVHASAGRKIWFALPGEVERWWRCRREMRLVKEGGKLRITGPSSERAVIAFAGVEDGRIVYEVGEREPVIMRSSA